MSDYPPPSSPPSQPGQSLPPPPPPGMPPPGMFQGGGNKQAGGKGGMPPGQYPPAYPPYPPYPPYMMPKQRSFAGAIFTTLATTVLGLSIALNIYLLVYAGIMNQSNSARQNVLVNGDMTQRIYVIPVRGLLLEKQAEQLGNMLRIAQNDANTKAVVIDVDTPGGSVTASDQMYRMLLSFKNEKNVPVVVSQGALATSGGYYISAAGDYVFSQPSTLTGNIGVIASSLNFAGLMEKYGVEDATITSTGSEYKDSGSPYRKATGKDLIYLQDLIDSMYGQFTGVVEAGRKGKLKAPMSEIASGKAFLGEKALSLGLVDEIGYLEDAYGWAAKKAGLADPQVVVLKNPPTFADLLAGVEGRFTGTGGWGGAPGVNVKIDAGSLMEMQTPRLMYLWRGE